MEAREWAKKRLYSEESHPEKWEMIDVEHAYLAGLLAERARGLGTGEDEGVSANDIAQAMFDAKVELGQLVPASEVERLRADLLECQAELNVTIIEAGLKLESKVSEAVKRERERCARAFARYKTGAEYEPTHYETVLAENFVAKYRSHFPAAVADAMEKDLGYLLRRRDASVSVRTRQGIFSLLKEQFQKWDEGK